MIKDWINSGVDGASVYFMEEFDVKLKVVEIYEVKIPEDQVSKALDQIASISLISIRLIFEFDKTFKADLISSTRTINNAISDFVTKAYA